MVVVDTSKEKIIQVIFNLKDWELLITKAASIDNRTFAGFVRDSAIKNSIEKLKEVKELPIDFYSNKLNIEEKPKQV